jgi:hypothetical protein
MADFDHIESKPSEERQMKAIERFGLSNLLGRKKRTSLQPTQSDFDGMTPLERQCYVSLGPVDKVIDG